MIPKKAKTAEDVFNKHFIGDWRSKQMANTSINFSNEKNGYNRQQVDSYINKLSEAYQATSDEYLDLNSKYENLLEYNRNLTTEERTELNSDILAKILTNAEVLAHKTIVDAQAEAMAVISEARKIVDDASSQAAKAEDIAQEIINDANAEAILIIAQATRILEHTRNTMEQSTGEINNLLAYYAPERQYLEEATGEVDKLLTLLAQDKEEAVA